MDSFKEIRTAEDVTDDLLSLVETIYDGWYADEPRIDWHNFLDRLERIGMYDMGSQMDSPAIKAIKKYVRKLKTQ